MIGFMKIQNSLISEMIQLNEMAVHVKWIKECLHSRPTWTKIDYEDFYERDVKLLLAYVDLLLEKHEEYV